MARARSARGYTLIEMLAVLAIIGILSTTILVGQNNFNRANLLTDTTYTVALSLRQMQSFGFSSRNFGTVNNAGYGAEFGSNSKYYDTFADIYPGILPATPHDIDIQTGVNGATYDCRHPATDATYPAERPGNCLYDLSQGEKLQRYTLNSGYTIAKTCYWNTFFAKFICYVNGLTLDILYERPNNQAVITYTLSGVPKSTTQAVIEITSPQGGTRCVIVTAIGQISVSSTCP